MRNHKLLKIYLSAILMLNGYIYFLNAQELSSEYKWELGNYSGVTWNVTQNELPHNDHIGMSGFAVDLILEWSIDKDGIFHADQLIRWPMLRTVPDNTHASLQRKLSRDTASLPLIEGEKLSSGKVKQVKICGALFVVNEHSENLESIRTIFPSVHSSAIIERFELINKSEKTLEVLIPAWKEGEITPSEKGVFGSYIINQFIVGDGIFYIAPGESVNYAVIRSARKKMDAPYFGNPSAEWAARLDFINSLSEELVLKTPDPVLNKLFELSKIRATESIFSTRGGLMHGPGGYNKYLAAIWANDQAEYINPFFPFLGNAAGIKSAMNSFKHFAKYMNPDYKPIPSSIIAEGRSFWNGAGDRGDMAMIAYGAARFALASGNPDYGEELWPLISWCLEYLERKELPDGSIASDSDELEGRFPAGDANLATISLYYDALISAGYLANELEKGKEISNKYFKKSEDVKTAISDNFEANVEGFDTYQYYEGNEALRSWIALPLTVGIFDRAEGTVNAIFSPKLWTDIGLLTKSGTETVWDRSTLYALKGVFQAGYIDRGIEKLKSFSRTRLLGDHVPYVIEATSEQNQSHLSAESGLYCRIFIEGIFGIRPTGFTSFESIPNIPKGWENISLENIHAFGTQWDMEILNDKGMIRVVIKDESGEEIYNERLPKGEPHQIDLQQKNM